MNSKFLGEYFKWGKIESEEDKLLAEIEQSKAEMEIAASVFNNVRDPLLVEVAIYAEKAAKKRYEYLIEVAKKNHISVDGEYIIERCTRLAKY
ncbi:YaaL family protein [Clostridium chrysemydis]|uniref:YaaL family protein n=1 Tax=Clostridium chrysemydis TaxID=2665504 RepID=UPI0018836F9F|nr:YaaL family protein [Clostridium chrysemydis]